MTTTKTTAVVTFTARQATAAAALGIGDGGAYLEGGRDELHAAWLKLNGAATDRLIASRYEKSWRKGEIRGESRVLRLAAERVHTAYESLDPNQTAVSMRRSFKRHLRERGRHGMRR